MLNNIDNFIKFLDDNHIIATVIATMISTYITALSQSLTNDLLLPIFSRDGDGDGQEDIRKYQSFVIEIFKVKFRVGSFLVELFKFLVMTFLIFMISNGTLNKKK